jgi:hypothetical protein
MRLRCPRFVVEVDSDGIPGTLRSVSVQKRYRDGDDVKYTSSFNLSELPQAIRVLQLAPQHVEACEAGSTPECFALPAAIRSPAFWTCLSRVLAAGLVTGHVPATGRDEPGLDPGIRPPRLLPRP